MSWEVVVLPSAHGNFQALAESDREVLKEALAVASELRENPWLGKEMRSRLGLTELKDCRRVPFDRPEYRDNPRYRLVYRNEPSDGSVAIVAVLAAGEREGLKAYRDAKPRLIERVKEQGDGPAPGRRDALARLVLERHATPARVDLLDLEPLELPSGLRAEQPS